MGKKDTEIAALKEQNAKLKGKKGGKGEGKAFDLWNTGELIVGGYAAGYYDSQDGNASGDSLVPALAVMAGGWFMKQKDAFRLGLGALIGNAYVAGQKRKFMSKPTDAQGNAKPAGQ